MPKSSNHVTLVRQWEILRKLPARGPGITASALVSSLRDVGFPVTKRTVERDLIQLSRLFGICCNDESIPYGWHWLPGADRELSSPDIPECLSLVVAEQTLRALLPAAILSALEPKFQLARTKLSVTANGRYANWADRVRYVPAGAPLQPPKVNPAILAMVQEALLAGRQLMVSYLAPNNPKPSRLTLHPLGFVQRATTPYLVATAFEYQDVRLYAVHRIQRAELTHLAVTIPSHFDLNRYLAEGAMEFTSGKTLRLAVWASPELGIQLAETPLSPDQTITSADGGHRVRAKVTDSWQLRWWILSQGDAIRVERPTGLRKEIQGALAAALRGYATSS